jgi:hypothetical protein
MTHFISQSTPDIRKKLKRLENGPQTPQAEILNVAFKAYNYREQQRADRRGEIRLNSRCWHKPSDKNLQPLTPKTRENPKHLPTHVFRVALKDTGPMLVLNHATHQGHVLSANRRVTG